MFYIPQYKAPTASHNIEQNETKINGGRSSIKNMEPVLAVVKGTLGNKRLAIVIVIY